MYDYTATSSSFLELQDCKNLIDHGQSLGFSIAHSLNKNYEKYLDLSHRKCKVVWFYDRLPFENVDNLVKTNLLNFAEKTIKADHFNQWIFQIAEYKQGDFHEWHIDDHENREQGFRKFVTIVQLSDPSDYDGGELEIINERKINKQQGSCVSFLTTRRHRVTPVIKGTRYSLVAWLIGPPWR